MDLMKRYVGKHRKTYITSVVLAVFSVIAGLMVYIILANVIVGLIEGKTDLNFYVRNCFYMLAGLVWKEIFAAMSTSISHKATFYLLKEIREDISTKLFNMPLGNILNISSGKLKNIIVDQVDSMETTLAHLIPELAANIVGPLLLFAYMTVLDWKLSFLSLVPLVIGVVCMKSVMKSYANNYQESVEINQCMNRAIVEYINGIEVIKMFNQSEKSYQKYSEAVYRNASCYYNWMKRSMMAMSVYRKVSPMSLLTILPFGIYFYMYHNIPVSSFITIIVLSFGTVEHILTATNYMDDLYRIGTITKEVGLILDAPSLEHGKKPVQLSNYDVELKDVRFSYEEDKKILDGLSLTIRENQVAAFVGPSGGGKSTITKLIAGFWNADSGEIMIGNENVKKIPLEQLSEMISYVSQDNDLFDMSVRENIRIGNPKASDEEVEQMARLSGCDGFIRNLAGAMLKAAPIVILDEATSYMDAEKESIIQEAISNLVKNKTLILIAHRLRTIVGADQIFVVENGKIESSGTHKELLENSVLYKSMWGAA